MEVVCVCMHQYVVGVVSVKFDEFIGNVITKNFRLCMDFLQGLEDGVWHTYIA